jgi:hypothetical protein
MLRLCCNMIIVRGTIGGLDIVRSLPGGRMIVRKICE